ncbi:hypothetical protein B0H10DRAFT_1939133 [Mycena sp. CBHHK59/15]|nr:hypothetical protein B0H10DRAFT_1939133 [Mycena sp. CBHHK59/15]
MPPPPGTGFHQALLLFLGLCKIMSGLLICLQRYSAFNEKYPGFSGSSRLPLCVRRRAHRLLPVPLPAEDAVVDSIYDRMAHVVDMLTLYMLENGFLTWHVSPLFGIPRLTRTRCGGAVCTPHRVPHWDATGCLEKTSFPNLGVIWFWISYCGKVRKNQGKRPNLLDFLSGHVTTCCDFRKLFGEVGIKFIHAMTVDLQGFAQEGIGRKFEMFQLCSPHPPDLLSGASWPSMLAASMNRKPISPAVQATLVQCDFPVPLGFFCCILCASLFHIRSDRCSFNLTTVCVPNIAPGTLGNSQFGHAVVSIPQILYACNIVFLKLFWSESQTKRKEYDG